LQGFQSRRETKIDVVVVAVVVVVAAFTKSNSTTVRS